MDSGKKDGESIINQQEYLKQHIADHPEFTLKAIFTDNGESGVDFHRPAWSDLMRECRTGRINCIIVKDLSRIGRNYIETGEYLDKIFPLLGVRLIAVNDGYDNISLTSSERLMANLKNVVNDIYAKDISRKSSTALRTKQKEGAFIGTYATYGYLKDPNDKNKIIVDPETAPIVKQIFEWKAEGIGNAQICRKLIDMGIPAPNKYRYDKGIVKDARYAGSEWATTVIIQMLKKEIYLGHMVQGRKRGALYEDGGTHKMIDPSAWTVVRDTHEPIISQTLFDRVNSIMSERSAEFKSRLHKYDHFEKPPLLLKDLLFCSDCGKPLYRYKSVTSGGKYVHWIYQCRTHDTLQTCPLKYVNEVELYQAVYDTIRVELQMCANISETIVKLNRESGHKATLARFDSEIAESESELRRISSLKQGVFEDYAAKVLTLSEYQYATEKYNSDTEKQKARLEAARCDKAGYIQGSTPTNKWVVAFSQFMDEKVLTADMVKALVERVDVSDRNRATVTFKFRDELAAISSYAEVA